MAQVAIRYWKGNDASARSQDSAALHHFKTVASRHRLAYCGPWLEADHRGVEVKVGFPPSPKSPKSPKLRSKVN